MEKLERGSKPLRAIDHLPGSPLKALEEVWKELDLHQFIHWEINIWFYMAMSNDCAIYVNDDGEMRAEFIALYADILPIIEASYCCYLQHRFYKKNGKDPDLQQLIAAFKDKLCYDYTCVYLSHSKMLDPEQVMVNFCIKYTIEFVRRELWDFLQSAESYSGPFRAKVSKYMFSENYLNLLTIVEASYCLASGQEDSD
jgi:hypothetical protein